MFENFQLGMIREFFAKISWGETDLNFEKYLVKGKRLPIKTFDVKLNTLAFSHAVGHENTVSKNVFELYHNPNHVSMGRGRPRGRGRGARRGGSRGRGRG